MSVRVANSTRSRGTRVAATVGLGLLLAGCGLWNSNYRGEVIEPPIQGEGDAARDNWCVLTQLDEAEVVGTDVVYVCFFGSELTCDDGEPLKPDSVPAGAELKFTRAGDGADTSSPPGIRGRALQVDCP